MVRKFKLPFTSQYGIRLYRIGCNNRPFYLIGAMPRKVPVSKGPERRPDEVIGSVDPMPNERGELLVSCDLSRLNYYLGKGATPSRLLAQFLGLAGYLPPHPKLFINAWRSRAGLPTRNGLRDTVHPAPRPKKSEEQLAADNAAISSTYS